MDSSNLEYAGFWIRVWATLIDTALLCILILPILGIVYGREYWTSTQLIQGPVDVVLSWIAPAIAVVLFWVARQATPGKMVISARIVDARTGLKPTTGQLVGRYLGYFVAMIPLFVGILWVAFDPRKQGWHDKLAGTVVVRNKGGVTEPVRFDGG